MNTELLELFDARLRGDRSLAVLITKHRASTDPQVAVVNAAMIAHPTRHTPVIALVARPGAKLRNLRTHPRATVVARDGWEWAAARGPVELCGPDDPLDGIDLEQRRQLLRTIYHAAGGRHPNLDDYDRAMVTERRCAVLIQPEHIWTNPAGSEHLEPESTPQ